MPMKYWRRPPLKHLYIYIYIFKEVRQKVVIYNVITVGFCPSSINQLLIYIGKFSIKVSPELLPPIRIIRVLNINKNKPVKDWLKVIRQDVLYTLNKVQLNGSISGVNEAPAPLLLSNRTDQRLQYQLYTVQSLQIGL